MGIFSSSIVILFVTIPAYLVSKSQMLERYWDETRIILRKLYEIKYLYLNFNKDDFIEYITELRYNENAKKMNNELGLKKKYKNESKKKLITFLKNEDINIVKMPESKDLTDYLIKQLDFKTNEIITQMEEIINIYIECSKISVSKLNQYLGDIDFFSGRKEYTKIHKDLYQPIYDILNEIREQTYHMQLYNDGKGNQIVVLEKIIELQSKIFKLEEVDRDNVTYVNIYNKFDDKMQLNSENFRAKIYDVKPEEVKTYIQGYYLKYYNEINK